MDKPKKSSIGWPALMAVILFLLSFGAGCTRAVTGRNTLGSCLTYRCRVVRVQTPGEPTIPVLAVSETGNTPRVQRVVVATAEVLARVQAQGEASAERQVALVAFADAAAAHGETELVRVALAGARDAAVARAERAEQALAALRTADRDSDGVPDATDRCPDEVPGTSTDPLRAGCSAPVVAFSPPRRGGGRPAVTAGATVRTPRPRAPVIWRTPPTGYVTGFASAPEVACRIPTNGQTACVSLGPHGLEQMARLTDGSLVTGAQTRAAGVTTLSPRWRVGGMASHTAALLRNNRQPWGPIVVACLAETQPTGRNHLPVYISSRWGRRPGNAVTNMTIAEFRTTRGSECGDNHPTTLHVTGQPVHVVLDPEIGSTWSFQLPNPPRPEATPLPAGTSAVSAVTDQRATSTVAEAIFVTAATPAVALAFAPLTHLTVPRTEVMAQDLGPILNGNVSKVGPATTQVVWWREHRERWWQRESPPCALA